MTQHGRFDQERARPQRVHCPVSIADTRARQTAHDKAQAAVTTTWARSRTAPAGDGPRAGSLVWLSERGSEPPAYRDADGSDGFDELVPGDGTVTSGAPGRTATGTGTLTVEAARVITALEITPPVQERLYGDGFESEGIVR